MTKNQMRNSKFNGCGDPKLEALRRLADTLAFHPKLTDGCFSNDRLAEYASNPQQQFFEFQHVQECPRCNATYYAYRASRVLKLLPKRWNLAVSLDSISNEDDGFSQVIGFVDLESRCFEASESDFDWRPSRLRIRVNVVVDAKNKVFSVVLLDAGKEIQGAFAITNSGKRLLDAVEPRGTYQILLDDDVELIETNAEFISRILGGKELILQFQSGSESLDSMPTLKLLELFEAVESKFDYVLPCGLMSKTYLNSARLCESSVALTEIAKRLDAALPYDLDVIVSNCWPMANVARRIARIRNLRADKAFVRDVLCEGYLPTVLTDDIPSGAKVVVIADVVVSGTQVHRIRQCIEQRNADVVGLLLSQYRLKSANCCEMNLVGSAN